MKVGKGSINEKILILIFLQEYLLILNFVSYNSSHTVYQLYTDGFYLAISSQTLVLQFDEISETLFFIGVSFEHFFSSF